MDAETEPANNQSRPEKAIAAIILGLVISTLLVFGYIMLAYFLGFYPLLGIALEKDTAINITVMGGVVCLATALISWVLAATAPTARHVWSNGLAVLSFMSMGVPLVSTIAVMLVPPTEQIKDRSGGVADVVIGLFIFELTGLAVIWVVGLALSGLFFLLSVLLRRART